MEAAPAFLKAIRFARQVYSAVRNVSDYVKRA